VGEGEGEAFERGGVVLVVWRRWFLCSVHGIATDAVVCKASCRITDGQPLHRRRVHAFGRLI
jgi:hypothetical protein